MNPKLSKHISIVGLTFIITSLTSFSNKPEMSAVVGIIGSLMLLTGKLSGSKSKQDSPLERG